MVNLGLDEGGRTTHRKTKQNEIWKKTRKVQGWVGRPYNSRELRELLWAVVKEEKY